MTGTSEDPKNPRDCPNCGLPREDWPDDASGGYVKDGVVYCCSGCIGGTGCTCLDGRVAGGGAAPTAEQIRDDPASGRFVRSLQHQTDHIGPEHYGTDVTTEKPPASSASND